MEDWLDKAECAVKLVGEGHVGNGLDMMTGGSQIRTFDATSCSRFTEAIAASAYSDTRIRKILSENWLRLFDRAKAPTCLT